MGKDLLDYTKYWNTESNTIDYSKYDHPKANVPNFWEDDYKVFYEEEKDGFLVKHAVNSGGRIRIVGSPTAENSNLLPFYSYPGGGCNSVGGTTFCSFGHIDWSLPKLSKEGEKAEIERIKQNLKKLGLEK